MAEHEHGFGWRPSPPDFRDFKFGYRAVAVPPSLDLRETAWMPPVVDQGNLGSCTANMAAACFEFEARKQGARLEPRSRLFIYYNERAIEGTIPYDAGAYCRDAFKVLNHHGAPPETTWPYDVGRFAEEPPTSAFRSGVYRQALTYEAVPQQQVAICAALAQRQLVGFGFAVYSSFRGIGPDGLASMPRPSEALDGGHAVAIVGYTEEYAFVRNSWGEHWGHDGYFSMPWAYVLNPDLAGDFWTVSLVEVTKGERRPRP